MVTRLISKPVLTGILMGIVLMFTAGVGAMSARVDGWLYTKNPLFDNPKGYAKTMGCQTITAEVKVTKGGKTNSQKVSKSGGVVETDWVSGPTYSSSGTVFKSIHTGYDIDGNYEVLYASRSY